MLMLSRAPTIAIVALLAAYGCGSKTGQGGGFPPDYGDSGIPVENCIVGEQRPGPSYACGDGVIVITVPVTESFPTDAAPTESGTVYRGQLLDGGYGDFVEVNLPAGSPLCVCPAGTGCTSDVGAVSCK
jgi:hypothetical protein